MLSAVETSAGRIQFKQFLMQQKNIIIPKTARYFVSGEATEHVETIWFVCHGYGQLANFFIKNFEVLNNEKNLVIAPEGLHRFYWQGFSGKVVASWMTKEDRDDDIKDYINYLDAVYSEVLSQFKNKKVKINVLGFSQGAATVCRWIENKKCAIDKLILWAGAFPTDMHFEMNKDLFNAIKIYIIIGDNDEFINEQQVQEHENLLKTNAVNFQLIRFKGKHEIHQETLLQLANGL
jgi:predicted esterase